MATIGEQAGPTNSMLMARGYLAACDGDILPPRCAGAVRDLLGRLSRCPLDDGAVDRLLHEHIRSGVRLDDRLAAALVLAHWRHWPTREYWIEQGRLAPRTSAWRAVAPLATGAYPMTGTPLWADAAG